MDAAAVFELAWLAALAWPWTRLVIDRRRRLARTAPLHHAAIATVLVLAGAAAIVLAVHSPVGLHVTAAAATPLAAAAWWRARPSYGRSRRLPPGSLAVTRSILAIVDREFYAREARRHGPIFKMQFHRPVACVVGLERGHELMRRHRDSLGTTPLPWNRELRGGFLRYMEDATHEVYSPIFRIALAGRAVAAAEPATRRAARRELGALAAACADSPAAGVEPGPALDRIVLVAFAHALFGIDEESPDFGSTTAGRPRRRPLLRPDPGRPHRPGDAPPRESQYSPFGLLERACSGVDLSNMIGRVTLEELAAFDWAIASDGELERPFGHWSHWQPSSRLRIRLEQRASVNRRA